MPREGGRRWEPPALPRHPLPGGSPEAGERPRLAPGRVRAPPAHPGASCPARPPRSPRRRLGAVTPISGPRACPLRRRRAWARAPERALRPEKHLLCTEPGKLSPSLLAFMAADWGRGGGPRPAGVPGRGARGSTWCRDFSFYFFHPPPQPSFSQLREAGRTDVQRAPLPLPRGRWPGPAAPTWLRGCGSRGKEPANPGARAAGSPRGPDGAQRRGGRGQRGTRPPPTPRAAPAGALPAPRRAGPGRLAPPPPHPGSGAFAPAALGIWSPPSPGNRVAPGVCR